MKDEFLFSMKYFSLLLLLLLLSTMNVHAQQGITVTGTVTEKGEPLPGVNVTVKGTGVGTATDLNGRFSISVSSEGAVLVFNFIGFTAQEIQVGSRTVINVELIEDTRLLEEVVVVGYYSIPKANLSGAVDAISAKVLENRPVANVGQALQGVMPGLNIAISQGRADINPSFNIRGYTSINGGGPLILIDNIPTGEGELARLNPNDIESVAV